MSRRSTQAGSHRENMQLKIKLGTDKCRDCCVTPVPLPVTHTHTPSSILICTYTILYSVAGCQTQMHRRVLRFLRVMSADKVPRIMNLSCLRGLFLIRTLPLSFPLTHVSQPCCSALGDRCCTKLAIPEHGGGHKLGTAESPVLFCRPSTFTSKSVSDRRQHSNAHD